MTRDDLRTALNSIAGKARLIGHFENDADRNALGFRRQLRAARYLRDHGDPRWQGIFRDANHYRQDEQRLRLSIQEIRTGMEREIERAIRRLRVPGEAEELVCAMAPVAANDHDEAVGQ